MDISDAQPPRPDPGDDATKNVDDATRLSADESDASSASRQLASDHTTDALTANTGRSEATEIYDKVVAHLTSRIETFLADALPAAAADRHVLGPEYRPSLTKSGHPGREFCITETSDGSISYLLTVRPHDDWSTLETVMADLVAGRLSLTLYDWSTSYLPDGPFQMKAAYTDQQSIYRYVSRQGRDLPEIVETQNLLLSADLKLVPSVVVEQLTSMGDFPHELLASGHLRLVMRQERIPTIEQLLHRADELANPRPYDHSAGGYNDVVYEPELTTRMIIDSERPVWVTAIWNSKPELPERVLYEIGSEDGVDDISFVTPDTPWREGVDAPKIASRHEILIDSIFEFANLGVLAQLVDGSSTLSQLVADMRRRSEEIYDGDAIDYAVELAKREYPESF